MMTTASEGAAGLTPEKWRQRLEEAAFAPDSLHRVLDALEREMKRERSWVHDNPSPDHLLKGLITFFLDADDHDYERQARQIRDELSREAQLRERYRSWLPGEDAQDRLFLYVKDFIGQIDPDPTGVQFPGFLKYKGIHSGLAPEAYVFFLNERFPGRDPANFHVVFEPESGRVILKRIYRMELPRIKGASAARAVLAEMIQELVPDVQSITSLEVDNAANVETRQALMDSHEEAGVGVFKSKQGADVHSTVLGHLMIKLAERLGLSPGEFSVRILPFGLLEIAMAVAGR